MSQKTIFVTVLQMLIDLQRLLSEAPRDAGVVFLDTLTKYVNYFTRTLMKDSLPPVAEVIWCDDLGTAMEEVASLSFELHEWKTLFVSVETVQRASQIGLEHVLSVTSVNGHSWTTRLFPWCVAISIKDEFKEIFHSQQFLKILRTSDCEDRIIMDIAGLICLGIPEIGRHNQ